MRFKTRFCLASVMMAVGCLINATVSAADAYPARDVTIIVPTTAGGHR